MFEHPVLALLLSTILLVGCHTRRGECAALVGITDDFERAAGSPGLVASGAHDAIHRLDTLDASRAGVAAPAARLRVALVDVEGRAKAAELAWAPLTGMIKPIDAGAAQLDMTSISRTMETLAKGCTLAPDAGTDCAAIVSLFGCLGRPGSATVGPFLRGCASGLDTGIADPEKAAAGKSLANALRTVADALPPSAPAADFMRQLQTATSEASELRKAIDTAKARASDVRAACGTH